MNSTHFLIRAAIVLAVCTACSLIRAPAFFAGCVCGLLIAWAVSQDTVSKT